MSHMLDQENQLPELPPPAPLKKKKRTLQRHIILVGLVAVVPQLSVHMTKDGGPIEADSDGNFFSDFNVILEWNTGPTYKLSISGFAWFPRSLQEGISSREPREWFIPSKGKDEDVEDDSPKLFPSIHLKKSTKPD